MTRDTAPLPRSPSIESEAKTQEARVRNITAAIARTGYSEALGEQLGLEEETLRSLRQRLGAMKPRRRTGRPDSRPGSGCQVPREGP